MPRSIALLLLLVACESPRQVAVQVSIPSLDSVEAPVAGIEVLALPYDRDSLLRAFHANAASPRPDTKPLDSAFADFRGPFVAYSTAAYQANKLRDTVTMLAAQLDHPASATDTSSVRARWKTATAALEAAELRRDSTRQALSIARDRFRNRSDSLRAAIRSWEDSTYQAWDSVVRSLTDGRGVIPQADTTDDAGWVQFKLRPIRGRWWIHARSWDIADPNAEWYWNVLVDADTIILTSKAAQHRPRY